MRYTNFESDEELQQFIFNVTSGPRDHLEFMLHALRRSGDDEFQSPSLVGWPAGTTVSASSEREEGDALSSQLFFISAPTVPSNMPDVLTGALEELMSQGSLLSWFVFQYVYDDTTTL